MSYYCHLVSYTSEAWSQVVNNPDDRLEAIRVPIEKMGGKVSAGFFTSGHCDVLVISEFSEKISPADISTAFAHGGKVARIQTLPLLTASQAIEARVKAAQPVYSSHRRKYQAVATGS